jgi:branched-chain amino acid transport system permease protein
MSLAWQFYISTVLVYLGVNVIACWGLNLQYGVAGVYNFAFIVFQAAGAYTAAVLTLGPMTTGNFQQYIGGNVWIFPFPLIAAALVGALLSAAIGLITLHRLRADYQAMVLLVVSLIATSVAVNQVGLLNGAAGLSLVPKPLQERLQLPLVSYQWFYVGLTAAACVVVYWFTHRITAAPLGRAMRAVRDNEQTAAAIGKRVTRLRMLALVIGGGFAGLSGGLLVEFIGTWAPGGWQYRETFLLFTAVIVGGAANNFGAALGALVVPILFLEATRFLPEFGYPGLIDALQWIVIGMLTLLFLWFRPKGLIPERLRRFPSSWRVSTLPADDAVVGTQRQAK